MPKKKTYLVMILFMALVGVSFLLSVPSHGAEQNDAGDSRETACPIPSEWTSVGFLGDGDEEDWYRVDLERGDVVCVFLDVPALANLDLYVYPAGRNTLVRSTYGLGIDETVESYAVGEAGTCYLRIVLRDGSGTYHLTIDVQNQDDAGMGMDASNVRASPDVLLPGAYVGLLLDSDDVDWYAVECLDGQILSVGLLVPNDADFDLLTRYRAEHHGKGQHEEVQYVVPRDGGERIGVLREEGSGRYELIVTLHNQDDAGSGSDAGDTGPEALPISSGRFAGFLGPGDGADWYAIEMEQGETLILDFSVPEGAKMRLSLYHPGASILYGPCGGGIYESGDHARAIDQFVRHNDGTWLINVDLMDGQGTYALGVTQNSAEEGAQVGVSILHPDGVAIPFLRKDPAVASGSTCRGACGSGCPDTCQDCADIVRCLPDQRDENAHTFVTYSGVIECGTHAGCRQHDACFDDCEEEYGEESVVAPCHDECSAAIVREYGVTRGASWALGYGPYDGYFLYSEEPVWSEPESGQLQYTEYRVDVTTGDIPWTLGEGTDARVYLTLLGTLFGTSRCSSAEIRLDTPNHNDFETGHHDSFIVTAERFDSVEGIVLRHDNTSLGPGWYVGELSIMELSSGVTWRVIANRWIALDEEDGRLRVEFEANLLD